MTMTSPIANQEVNQRKSIRVGVADRGCHYQISPPNHSISLYADFVPTYLIRHYYDVIIIIICETQTYPIDMVKPNLD